ncbi:hypothetical protein FRACYDRAFT_238432 [Fragilariopsis cylindrus CCMP1102]|uniref:SAM domain-containing protein n=1 Tax=Fragilariopsis cylindrus CCMP1102 TaxID=635003 RepID=A0A1E7FIJ8_9STRA|nr:hypothetical protein FRACYDRAFT_238432 [Fragilariopsis cylindrus CCMP1102]|eukprot:OEU18001.1 hypothetical protein FRACYDRAFT_238432 [Fragilariopsis cylindrus CCMP1102]
MVLPTWIFWSTILLLLLDYRTSAATSSTAFCVRATQTITSSRTSRSVTRTDTTSLFTIKSNGGNTRRSYYYPSRIEEWDTHHVESWLKSLGYQKYVTGFAADFRGVGVDGNRLVYLGTPDQLDHIEYQLELLGVDDGEDQIILGRAIVVLVADDELVENMSLNNVCYNPDYDDSQVLDKDDDGANYQI